MPSKNYGFVDLSLFFFFSISKRPLFPFFRKTIGSSEYILLFVFRYFA